MNIYAFFDDVDEAWINKNDENLLIDLWKKSWIKYGWNPIILNLQDSKKHKDYDHFLNKINNYPTIHSRKYIEICYLRWLAIANIGGWYTDIDMINYGFLPFDPQDKVVTCSYTICPTTLYMNKYKYNKYIIDALQNYSFADNHVYDKSKDNITFKNTSDMLILHNEKISNKIDLCLNNQCDYNEGVDWNKHSIIHFHHGCFNINKMKRHEIILDYERNNRFKN